MNLKGFTNLKTFIELELCITLLLGRVSLNKLLRLLGKYRAAG